MPVVELRRARVAVSLVFAVHGAVFGTFATRIPWIADRLDASPGQLGIALVAPALGAVTTMPLAARLSHRFRSKPTLRVLLTAWCLSLAVPALAPSIPVLFVSLLLFGVTAGMADVAMNANGIVVEQRYGRSIMSSLHGLWSAGGLVAATVGAVAAARETDARVQLALTAAVLAGVGWYACGWLLDETLPGSSGPAFALPPRPVLLIGLVGFCAIFAEAACNDWSAIYVRDVTGASPGVAAIAFAAFAGTMTVGRLLGDVAIRRLGPVRSARAGGGVATLGCALVLLAGLVAARPPALAIVGFALIGLGIAVIVPLAFAAAGTMGPNPSQAIAGIATISYGSGLAAPGAVGGIAEVSSLSVSFGLAGVLCLFLIVGAPTLRRTTPASPVAPQDRSHR